MKLPPLRCSGEHSHTQISFQLLGPWGEEESFELCCSASDHTIGQSWFLSKSVILLWVAEMEMRESILSKHVIYIFESITGEFIYSLSYLIHLTILSACLCVYHVCIVLQETRRGRQILWSGSYQRNLSLCVGAGNRRHVLWNSSQCS